MLISATAVNITAAAVCFCDKLHCTGISHFISRENERCYALSSAASSTCVYPTSSVVTIILQAAIAASTCWAWTRDVTALPLLQSVTMVLTIAKYCTYRQLQAELNNWHADHCITLVSEYEPISAAMTASTVVACMTHAAAGRVKATLVHS
eukprot:2642-Heterococcus_DN1.PRE.1